MATANLSKIRSASRLLTAADFDTPEIRRDASRLLHLHLNQYQCKLNANLLGRLTDKFHQWLRRQQQSVAMQLSNVPKEAQQRWLKERFAGDRRKPERQAARYLVDFMNQEVQRLLGQLQEQKNDNRSFRKTLGSSRTELERREIILAYAKTLGATDSQLAEDRRAFERWFDEEAVTDRYAKLSGETELELSFAFERLGVLVDHVVNTSIQEADSQDENRQALLSRVRGLWNRLNIQSRILAALNYDGDARLHLAAVKCLRLATASIPVELLTEVMETKTLDLVHRIAVEGKADAWQQCEALTILSGISFEFALPILLTRLHRRNTVTDDIFVRRHILKLLEQNLEQLPDDQFDPTLLRADESPFVRQQAARLVFRYWQGPSRRAWQQLVADDPSECVRAAALLCIVQLDFEELRTNEALTQLIASMKSDQHEFVLRTALHVATTLLDQLVNRSPEIKPATRQHFCDRYQLDVLPAIRTLETASDSIQVRRWAAQAAERIHVFNNCDMNELYQKLRPLLLQIPIGRSKRLPRSWFRGWSEHALGRLFAVLSQDDFGYDLHAGWFEFNVIRGPQFAFRLWRFLFEFLNPATDKRQGISHCIGRISTAKLRAQSQILGELSETKVPGEPLTIASDGTWRPFLPLLDDFVSVLNKSWIWPATVHFYSSQGMTSVTGPRSILKRMLAAWRLNTRFQDLADLRNWDDSSFPANRFVQQLRKMGFEISFARYPDTAGQTDESVDDFFRAAGVALPLAGLMGQSAISNYIYRFVDYFSAAFENTLEELIIFAVLVLLFFCAKHFWSNYTFRQARNRIPLSVGGWGTRGKSGTERLKAALFAVLGHPVVSKTTGCEAMFIHGYALGDPIEIPLFRPYDKATIWEQSNLIRLAAKLKPSVFLWECMALNPTYVDLLQRQWMRDDLTTITNTYPDHEDIQGPAGHNVAQTITCFVPVNSVCVSTEQVMRPYVTEECRKMKTLFKGVGWLESGMITPDILDRFPYQEHPDNIALVAAMASFLGVGYEFSLKAMADFLVPDLGVLKTHPVSTVRHRKIEFTNGCSANERFGCMGNWKRLGFDSQDPWQDPCTWITGVVNNRADRVPRSKVFAKIIVEDIHADRFFLIGNNLEGLRGFIDEAWDEHSTSLTLKEKNDQWSAEFAVAAFKQHAWNMRQPTEIVQIKQKLQCMLQSIVAKDKLAELQLEELIAHADAGNQIETTLKQHQVEEPLIQSIVQHVKDWYTALNEYQQMLQKIESASSNQYDSIEEEFRKLMKKWYFRKIVVVDNYYATGEEVVHTIVEETPPGFTNRVMGLQNIKGTGLDFVYRFQAWQMCHEACELIFSNLPGQVEKGLQSLVAMPEIGQLCQEHLAATVRYCRGSKDVAQYSDLVDLLEQKLELTTVVTDLPQENEAAADSSNNVNKKLHDWIYSTAEQILDVNDSVRRRERADKIYDDLGELRISRQRAITELREITKRQKGGWLSANKSA